MKKSLLITFIVLAMATIIGFTVFALTEKDTPNNDEALADETVSTAVVEAEKILDLTEYAKILNYTEINDETLSEIAKLTLKLYEEYDKILVEYTWYTSLLGSGRPSITFQKSETNVNYSADYKFLSDKKVFLSHNPGIGKLVIDCSKDIKIGNSSLVFLGLMLEVFSDDFYFGDQVWLEYAPSINRYMAAYLVFTTNYKNLGFETIEDYLIAKEKLSDEITVVKNDELFTRELIGASLTKDETEKLQKLKEKRDKLFEEQDKLNEGMYYIGFKHFSLDKIDGNEEWAEGVGYVDYSEWKSVADIAKIK